MTNPEPTINAAIRMWPRLRPRLQAYCDRHPGVSLNTAMNETMERGLDADEALTASNAQHRHA